MMAVPHFGCVRYCFVIVLNQRDVVSAIFDCSVFVYHLFSKVRAPNDFCPSQMVLYKLSILKWAASYIIFYLLFSKQSFLYNHSIVAIDTIPVPSKPIVLNAIGNVQSMPINIAKNIAYANPLLNMSKNFFITSPHFQCFHHFAYFPMIMALMVTK